MSRPGGVVMCLCEGDQRGGGGPRQTEDFWPFSLVGRTVERLPGVVAVGVASPMPFWSSLCVSVPVRVVFAVFFCCKGGGGVLVLLWWVCLPADARVLLLLAPFDHSRRRPNS